MRKIAIVITAGSLIGVLAFGCSSTTTSGSAEDAGRGDAKSPEASTGSPDADTCTPPATMPDFVPPAWKPPVAHKDACTQEDIANFYTWCLDETVDAGDAGAAKCDEALATACGTCIVSKSTAAAYSALIVQSSGGVRVNVAGCMALVDGDSTAAGCGAGFDAALACTEEACAGCTDDAAFSGCADATSSGACSTYWNAATCPKRDGGSDSKVCWEGTTFKDLFLASAAVFCLAGPAGDAGGDDAGVGDGGDGG